MGITKIVVITKNNKRIITRFRDSKLAKAFRLAVKKWEDPHVAKICTVSAKPKYPEKGEQRERGKLWCPYCAKHRAFRKAYRGDDYRWCEICGISDADFHVKVINKLEADANGEKSYPTQPREIDTFKKKDKYIVHRKIKCSGKSCQDLKIRLQWITAEEKKKRKGNVTMYCPKCGLKTTADAKELHKWLAKH